MTRWPTENHHEACTPEYLSSGEDLGSDCSTVPVSEGPNKSGLRLRTISALGWPFNHESASSMQIRGRPAHRIRPLYTVR